MVDLHFYDVIGTFPPESDLPEGGQVYLSNCDKHVVAESASMAIELVMKKHPGGIIHSVQHRGKIDIAQEIPSDANLTEPYYCTSPNCIDHSGDGTTVRPKLEKDQSGLWYCPICRNFQE